jgi:hypothetical protein
MVPDSLKVARQWMNARLPDDAFVAMDWIDVPRLVSDDEVWAMRSELRTDFVWDLYEGLRTFPTVEIAYTEQFLETTEADWLVTSSTCYQRFFEFGTFTRIRPSPDTDLGREFERRRRFYDLLEAEQAGWELWHVTRTGNGPVVRIYRRWE